MSASTENLPSAAGSIFSLAGRRGRTGTGVGIAAGAGSLLKELGRVAAIFDVETCGVETLVGTIEVMPVFGMVVLNCEIGAAFGTIFGSGTTVAASNRGTAWEYTEVG